MAKRNIDKEFFPGKTVGQVYKEVYERAMSKSADIDLFVQELRKLIVTPADAMLITPMIEGFIGKGLIADEHVIKVLSVHARTVAKEGAEKNEVVDGIYSEADLAELKQLSSGNTENQIPNDINTLLNAPEIIPADSTRTE